MKASDWIIGTLAVLGFGGAGAWILTWTLQTAQLSQAAEGWPTVPGRVVAEGTYAYEVDGRTLQGTRLGFDVFDEPGGRGTMASRRARYPVGAAVTVYVDPTDPTRAVLEPGDLSPFGMPALFGALFSFFGLFFAVRLAREATGRGPIRMAPETRVRVLAGAMSLVFATIFVIVSLESGPQEVQAALLGGWRPLGLPPWAVFLGLGALVFAPVPWGLVHLVRLNEARAAVGWGPVSGVLGLVLALQPAAPGGRSKAVVAGVGLWCALWLAGFLVWTVHRGV